MPTSWAHKSRDYPRKLAGNPKVEVKPVANVVQEAHEEVSEDEDHYAFSVVETEPESSNIVEDDVSKLGPWVVKSAASHHYTNDPRHIDTNLKISNGTVTTAGTETLEVTAKGTNDDYGDLKLIPKISRCLLSVGQLTNDGEIDVKLRGNYCRITKRNKVIGIGIKGVDNLYRIKDSNKGKVLSVADTQVDTDKYSKR